MNLRRAIIAIAFLALAVAGYAYSASRNEAGDSAGTAMVSVTVPALSASQQQGERAYNENCAACHGANGAGQDGVAPPLVHRIYEPSHHGDAAFFIAARNGVRAHHWPFGDMPPVAGVTDADIASIVDYVRALQRANGID